MDEQEVPAKVQIPEFVRNNIAAIAIGGVGLVFVVVGLAQYFGHKEPAIVIEEEQTDAKPQAKPTQKAVIIIDVSGAVFKPGVYELEEDARVQDALLKAGGVTSEADQMYISKSLNLAQQLHDGMKVYIPRVGESMSVQVAGAMTGPGKVSLNSASQQELESLPAIGPVTAQRIMQGRPYTEPEELVKRKIVNQSAFEKIKDQIVL